MISIQVIPEMMLKIERKILSSFHYKILRLMEILLKYGDPSNGASQFIQLY